MRLKIFKGFWEEKYFFLSIFSLASRRKKERKEERQKRKKEREREREREKEIKKERKKNRRKSFLPSYTVQFSSTSVSAGYIHNG